MKMQNSEIIQSFENICGGKGIRDGAVVRALGDICGLSLLLVLVVAPRGFSPGTPVFTSPQKPTFLNSNSIWKVAPS